MDNLPVNITDIVVAGVLIISGLLAYARGFVHEVLSVAAWVGAILATLYGLPSLSPLAADLIAPYLSKEIPLDLAAGLAAAIVIFVITLVILSLLTRAITKRIRDSALSVLDRALGFVFGVLRGGLIVCVAYALLEWTLPAPEQPHWLRSARSMPLIETGADVLKALLPGKDADRAAAQAREKARKLLENQKVYRDMLSPEPKATAPADTSGYDKQERREMDRLIEGSQ